MTGRVLAYPPPDHVLRELGLEVDLRPDGTLQGHLPVTDAVRTAAGEPVLGVVATMVDMMGGMASIRACTPDRVATADMTVHLLPTGGTDRLDGTLHVRRRGRRTLVVEVDLAAADGTPAGLATISFAVLPQPPGAPVLSPIEPGRRHAVEPAGVGGRRYAEALGLRTGAPGVVEIDVTDQVRNSLGALNGGFLTSAIDAAAADLAADVLGRAAATTELHIAFLELGRVGPVRATARPVGDPAGAVGTGRLTVDVEVVDAGNDDQVLTRATGVAVAA